MLKEVNPQFEKARSPISVSPVPLGKLTVCIVQPSKALSPIDLTVFAIDTDSSMGYSFVLKSDSPIPVTPSFITIFLVLDA